jgi:hypothetical protein
MSKKYNYKGQCLYNPATFYEGFLERQWWSREAEEGDDYLVYCVEGRPVQEDTLSKLITTIEDFDLYEYDCWFQAVNNQFTKHPKDFIGKLFYYFYHESGSLHSRTFSVVEEGETLKLIENSDSDVRVEYDFTENNNMLWWAKPIGSFYVGEDKLIDKIKSLIDFK